MKLIDALKLAAAPAPAGAEPISLALVCGFTSEQFQTLLAAHLRSAKPKRTVEFQVGLFGDLAGNLERLAVSEAKAPDAVVVPIEWSDLDERLSLRRLGGWQPEAILDIVDTAAMRLQRIEAAVTRLAASSVVAVSFPTLPLPPASFETPRHSGMFATGLRAAVAASAARLAAVARIRIADAQALDLASPLASRLDVRSEFTYGYPYLTPHASALAGQLAALIDPPAPKKGIITDLDDTLWRGLVGEIGGDQVAWDLDHHAQIHGLYQQMLRSLGAAGVLLAIASKNDPRRTDEAFARDDIAIKKDSFFPVEVSWGPKSAAVARIVKEWNIGFDAVVFIDDSPLELAEVKAAHPDVECLRFPKGDDQAGYALILKLREMFGKEVLGAEDALRLESLRRGAEARAAIATSSPVDFLKSVEAVIEITEERDPQNRRPFELINKTNQFNLNGRRVTEAAWLARLADPQCFTLGIGYRDKFGPLGNIAVLSGHRDGKTVNIDHWVMSCRAFSRQIEHRMMTLLVERYAAEAIVLDYEATAKNGPTQDFLRELVGARGELQPGLRLDRATIEAAIPATYHAIEEKTRG